MKKQGIRFFLLRALARQLQKQADFLFKLIGEEERLAPQFQVGNKRINTVKQSIEQDRSVESAAAETPPAHWLARADAGEPPAHWLRRVHQSAPELLAKKELAIQSVAKPPSLLPAWQADDRAQTTDVGSSVPASVTDLGRVQREHSVSVPQINAERTTPAEQYATLKKVVRGPEIEIPSLTPNKSDGSRWGRVRSKPWLSTQVHSSTRGSSPQGRFDEDEWEKQSVPQASLHGETERASVFAPNRSSPQDRFDEREWGEQSMPQVSLYGESASVLALDRSSPQGRFDEREGREQSVPQAFLHEEHASDLAVWRDGALPESRLLDLFGVSSLTSVSAPGRERWQSPPVQAGMRWPSLPDEVTTNSQDWEMMRLVWERQQRLDEEQQGNLWNA
jgi:hypothetical protein